MHVYTLPIQEATSFHLSKTCTFLWKHSLQRLYLNVSSLFLVISPLSITRISLSLSVSLSISLYVCLSLSLCVSLSLSVKSGYLILNQLIELHTLIKKNTRTMLLAKYGHKSAYEEPFNITWLSICASPLGYRHTHLRLIIGAYIWNGTQAQMRHTLFNYSQVVMYVTNYNLIYHKQYPSVRHVDIISCIWYWDTISNTTENKFYFRKKGHCRIDIKAYRRHSVLCRWYM